jgi:hypothetical protein
MTLRQGICASRRFEGTYWPDLQGSRDTARKKGVLNYNTAKASKVALYCITEKYSKFSTGFNSLILGYCKMDLWLQLLSSFFIVWNFFKIWLRVSSHETLCILSRQGMKLGIVCHSYAFFAMHKKPRQSTKKNALQVAQEFCIIRALWNFLGAVSTLAYS